MSNNDNVVDVVRLDNFAFTLRGFADLTREEYVTQSFFHSGLHWNLRVYPNGRDEDTRGWVSLFLCCCEVANGTIESIIEVRFSVRTPYDHHLTRSTGLSTIYLMNQNGGKWGWPKCWTHESAISICDQHGNLNLEVSIQVHPDESCWKPGKSIGAKVASLYNTKTDTDATFVIGNRRFEAHRLILKLSSPLLVEMVDNAAANQVKDVPITGANPDLFEMMIRFLYTEDLPPSFNDEDDAQELLKLADKFGCSDLKMLLEARIIEAPKVFCIEKAAELLVLADTKNCALVLERSLELIVKSIPDIFETEGWKEHVKDSPKLMQMIMVAQSNRNKSDALEYPSVSELRMRAYKQGMDADGTRQDLLMRLKANAEDNDESDADESTHE